MLMLSSFRCCGCVKTEWPFESLAVLAYPWYQGTEEAAYIQCLGVDTERVDTQSYRSDSSDAAFWYE